MKKILLIAAFMLLAFTSFAQNGRSIYNKYSECKGVSAVYISPALFRMMGKLPDMDVRGDDVNLTPIIKSLKGFYLINSENPEINGELRQDVDSFVGNGEYELLMEVKDGGEVVHMYTTGSETEVTGFILFVSEETECTFICLDGRMQREEFEQLLASQME